MRDFPRRPVLRTRPAGRDGALTPSLWKLCGASSTRRSDRAPGLRLTPCLTPCLERRRPVERSVVPCVVQVHVAAELEVWLVQL